MLITTKDDLRVGDEILVPSNSNFKYVKVLSIGKPGSKTTRCSIKKEIITIPATKWRKEHLQNVYKFEENTELHNCKINLDLRYRMIWLIKRENP